MSEAELRKELERTKRTLDSVALGWLALENMVICAKRSGYVFGPFSAEISDAADKEARASMEVRYGLRPTSSSVRTVPGSDAVAVLCELVGALDAIGVDHEIASPESVAAENRFRDASANARAFVERMHAAGVLNTVYDELRAAGFPIAVDKAAPAGASPALCKMCGEIAAAIDKDGGPICSDLATLLGLPPIVADPNVPAGEVHAVLDGKVVGRVTNIAPDGKP